MRACVLFLLVVASASAKYAWKDGNEYTYQVTGSTFASIHQVKNEHTGLIYRAQLRIRLTTDDALWAKLEYANYLEYQGPLPKDWEQREILENNHYQPLELTKQPFKIIMKNGVIYEVQISKEVPAWEENLIRSVVSQLQVNTKAENIIPSKLNALPIGDEVTAVYKTMEDVIEGKCEVLYDINRLAPESLADMPIASTNAHSEDWIEIVKTKNFSNCEQLPVYHFGLPRSIQWEPATNQMGDFLSRSSVARLILTGNLKAYTIQQSITTSKIILSPEIYNKQKGQVVSQMNLTLTSISAVSEKDVKGPSNYQSILSLVNSYVTGRLSLPFKKYSSASSESQEQIYMSKLSKSSFSSSQPDRASSEEWYQDEPALDESPRNPFALYPSEKANSYVRELVRKIGKESVNPQQVAKERSHELFAILTEVVRTMNYKQLSQSGDEFYVIYKNNDESNELHASWMAFRDAVAQAGTGPSLLMIDNWLSTKKIQGEEAAQILASQAEAARIPSTSYLKAFFELVKRSEVVEHTQLNTAAVFAFTNLIRLAQVDRLSAHNRYPVHTYGPLAAKDDEAVEQQFVPYFSQQLRQAVKEQNSQRIQLYIRALANIAHPSVLRVFEPYLEGKEPLTTFQRTLLVFSLNKISIVYPKLTRSVLYKIYVNQLEPYQVRVAAVYNIMKTNPPSDLLQRLAQSAHQEPSNQVRSAIKASIESLATMSGDMNKERRQNAASAVNMLPADVQGVQYSRANFAAYIIEGLNLAAEQHFKYIGSQDSLVPQSFFYKLTGSYNGLRRTGFRLGMMLSSPADLVDFATDSLNELMENEEKPSVKPKQEKQSWENIYKNFNVEAQWKKELEGNLLVNWAGSQRFMSFSNSSLKNFIPNTIEKVKEFTEKFVYQKRFIEDEIVLALPTAIGFPFVYTYSKPTLMSVSGRVLFDAEWSTLGSYIPQISVKPEIDVVISSQSQARFYIHSAFAKQYMAGYDKNIQVTLPISGSVLIDLTKTEFRSDIGISQKSNQKPIFHYSTWPFTTRRNALDLTPVSEEPKTKIVEVRQPITIDQIYGSDIGLAFHVKGRTEKKDVSFKTLYDQIVRQNLYSVWVFPTVENTIEATKVEIAFDNKHSSAASVVIMAKYRNSIEYDDSSEEQRKSVNKAIPSYQHPPMSEEGISQILKKVNFKDGKAHIFALTALINAPKSSIFSTTLAVSKKPRGEKSNLLFHVQTIHNDQRHYELALDASSEMPSANLYSFEEALNFLPKGKVSVKLNFGQELESSNQASIDALAVFERSRAREIHIREQPQTLQCNAEMQKGSNYLYGCRNATFHANLFDKYSVTLNYKHIPNVVKNQTYQVYSVLRHLGYPYVNENPLYKHEKTHQIEMDFQYSPDLTHLNVSVAAPVGRVLFQNLPVSNVIRSIAVIHPEYSVAQRVGFASLRQQYESTCSIESSVAKTFDNMTFPIHFEKYWHVLVLSTPQIKEDASLEESKRFAILARDIAETRRELQAVFDDFDNTLVEFLPLVPGVVVRVNEVELNLKKGETKKILGKAGEVIMEFTRIDDQLYKMWVNSYKFELTYSPERQLITASPLKMHHIGGLCGNFDGESSDRLTPQNEYLSDNAQFVSSWMLSPEAKYVTLQRLAQKHALKRLSPMQGNIVSEQDAGRADSKGKRHPESRLIRDYDSSSSSISSESSEKSKKTLSMSKKLMVIEHNGKLCFSTEAQPGCKYGQTVVETTPGAVHFVCVEKNKTSMHWAELVYKGARPDFSKKGNSQKIAVQIPTACSRP